MKEQLQQRLQALKAEYESGRNMLADLEARQANLRETLLRISGAMQVLEEELAKTSQPAEDTLEQREGAPQVAPAAEELSAPAG